MFNRKKKEYTPGTQATRAQTNIFVRIIGCGFLVYVIREMVTAEDFSTDQIWKVALAGFLGLAGLVIIVLTVVELVQNYKRGAYSAKYYGAEDVAEETAGETPEEIAEEIEEECDDEFDESEEASEEE